MSSLQRPIWDPYLRIFKWSFASLFVVAYVSAGENDAVHFFAGFTLAGLVLFRLVWGFVGSPYARWSNFLRGPTEVLRYLQQILRRQPRHFWGHNPAGGWMILLLLLLVAATVFTGMSMLAVDDIGPLAQTFASDLPKSQMADLHTFLADATLVMVVIHVLGVIVSSWIHGENLVLAMIRGSKPENIQVKDPHE